jgi:hypothetical protein
MAHAASTETLRVKAGDSIELVAAVPEPYQMVDPTSYNYIKWDNCSDGRGACSDWYDGWVSIASNFVFVPYDKNSRLHETEVVN